MKIDASWTNDCQGKQDYDGPILTLSTRYWPGPEGGAAMQVTAQGGRVEISDAPWGPQPTATADILLHFSDEDCTPLRTQDFTGATEADVKAQVEAWADAQFAEIQTLLLAHFGRATSDSSDDL